MPTILIQHSVQDFDAWRRAFDADPLHRARHGVTAHRVQRGADDPNSVVVMLEFATLEQARVFLPLLEGMWRAVGGELGFRGEGVQARILEEVERRDY